LTAILLSLIQTHFQKLNKPNTQFGAGSVMDF